MRCVAGWIEQYYRTHGHGPDMREIAAYAGFRSSYSGKRLVDQMRAVGLLQWNAHKARSATVQEDPRLGIFPSAAPTKCDQILGVLKDASGLASIGVIATRTGLPNSSVAALLAYMEGRGTVQRVKRGVWSLSV
jgi:hypothetical protein